MPERSTRTTPTRWSPFGLDENWLDVTGSVGLYGSPMTIAREISSRIKSELGITASIGVANNKITAKLGSDYKSRTPSPGSSRITTRRSSIPCRWKTCSMWGLPPPKSCGPLGSTPSAGWRSARKMCCSGALGKWGWSSVCSQRGGMSPLCRRRIIFQTSSPSATVATTPRDLVSEGDVQLMLLLLAESVCSRMRELASRCAVVEIYVRDTELRSMLRQRKLPAPSCSSQELAEVGLELFRRNYHWERPIRSIGCGAPA